VKHIGIPLSVVVLLLGLLALPSHPATAQPEVFPVYMTAVEYKGSTTVDREPFPTSLLPDGGGYIRKAPNQTGRWETSTYRWEPGFIFVEAGDEVELHIWGVNGDAHPTTIEGYDLSFVVTRGELTVVRFRADSVGRFPILCQSHQPSMTAWLIVQPS